MTEVPQVRAVPLYLQVIVGVLVGALVGVAFKTGPIVGNLTNDDLGALGLLVIRTLKALAVPLVLFAILDAFVQTKITARAGLRLLIICAVNVSVAFTIGLTLMNVLKPGAGSVAQVEKLKAQPLSGEAKKPLEQSAKGSISPMKAIDGYVPNSLVDPFLANSIIPVVLIALFVGAALRRLKDTPGGPNTASLETAIHALFQIFVQILGWVVHAVPYAVFGVVAQVVGKAGLDVFYGLAPFLGIVLLGMVLHSLVYYPAMAWLVGGKSPRTYLGGGLDAILTGLSTNSSLATVPITLKCLKKMGVSDASSRLAACIGTNLNNDGITLYEAMAALFVAQALGLELPLTEQLIIVAASLMAGIGIAGIPEAGLVMLPLVLGAMGLPIEMVGVAIAFVLPVDWILARARSAVNVMSDMLVAILLDRDPEIQR